MRRKLVFAVLGLLVLAVAGFVLRIVWIGGVFRSIEPHFDGNCRLVRGPVGPEDLTIHPRTGVAYVSAYHRLATQAGAPVPGGIYAYDLADPEAVPVNLTPDADITFQPHGISLWVDAAGRDVLFVINHPPAGTGRAAHTIEIFDLAGDELVHRASLTDPLLTMPNDLVAVGINRFYVTNTHKHGRGRLQTLETFLQLAGATVVHYGPDGFRIEVPNLVFPNGINVSPDGESVYVATVTPRSLLVYNRDPANDSLTFREEIFLGSAADNIEVDDQGRLWIGTHPKMLRLQSHRADPSVPAPSQVLRVTLDAIGGHAVEEIYLNDGREIAAASVAAVRGNRLLIGQIVGDGFLDCVMGEQSKIDG
jgi:arylesterase/paraoxonase